MIIDEMSDQNQTSMEKAVLLGVVTGDREEDLREAEASMIELKNLAEAAGATVVLQMLQRKSRPDAATYAGSGKILEARDAGRIQDANLLIFDNELSGSQIRNIEKMTEMKVIDRTLLILDIFARRAMSKEGKIQVELAQQTDRLSRLTGMGLALSRLGGGIGTRGPGETQLESDRRHIMRRVRVLKQELALISERRDRTREHRRNEAIRSVAIVGYTNAGKSTLMNRLCNSDLLVMDQVFATLDPTARKILLPDQQVVLAVDTVGFIRRLPHGLVDAFKATLEEVTECDIVLEVIDASDPDVDHHLTVVEKILKDLKAAEKPRILVLNKIDRMVAGPYPEIIALFTKTRGRPAEYTISISAISGEGVADLLAYINELIRGQQTGLELLIPFPDSEWLDYIQQYGRIDQLTYEASGIRIKVHVEPDRIEPLQRFIRLAQNMVTE
jgi:GTP-binding protein HflX